MGHDTLVRLRHDIGTFLNHLSGYSDLLAQDQHDDSLLSGLCEQVHSAVMQINTPLFRYFGKVEGEEFVSTAEIEEADRVTIFSLLYEIVSALQAAKHAAAERRSESALSDITHMLEAANAILGLVEERPGTDATSAPVEQVSEYPYSRDEAVERKSEYIGRVLIVDDDAVNRDILRRRIERMGHVVCIAENGEDALAIMKLAPFDIVILDVMMPKMNGFQLLERINGDERLGSVFVIVISSLMDNAGIARCIRLGAEDYMPREFDPIILRARIESCLEKKALRMRDERSLRAMMDSQKALASELREAADYVRSLLPRKAPMGYVRPDWIFVPSLSLGGDIFGYHEASDGRILFYLIDVSGHGIEAALVSVTLMNILKSQSLHGADFEDPSSVLAGLNAAFRMEEQNNLYFAAWYGCYDLSSRKLMYASAGSPPAVLIGPDGSRTELSTGGMVVGVDPEAVFHAESLIVEPGSNLYIFSDGIYEVKTAQGPVLSWEDFLGILSGLDATIRRGTSTLDQLASAVKKHCGKTRFDDDVSVLEFSFGAALASG
ncbi:MAG: SpoIIE family protein phosphatase [Spirochaetes bacterium]|nr:SpoIIE family protein phosphatase [Spirochaetota bacterium]